MIIFLCKQMHQAHKDQNGQSIVFVALILMTLAAFVAVTINIGNFVAAKIRMQNVVDAAALNGAVWEARGFNVIQAVNAAIFSGEYVLATYIAEAAYWLIIASDCGFWPWCWPLWVVFIEKTIVAVEAYFDIGDQIDDMNNVQHSIAQDITPINVALSWAYEITLNPYNESSWYYILPGTYFFSGSVLFEQTPDAGNWYDLFMGKLACNNTGGGLFYDKYYETTGDYPQHQWLFYFAYRDKEEAPMLRSQFDAGGVGYFVMAQARPYSKAGNSWLSYRHIYDEETWDVKLMPINFVDMLWQQLFGWFPPLQWLFSSISSLVLLH